MQCSRKPLTVSRPIFIALYIFGLFICIPTSLLVWFIRRRLFTETSVAGASRRLGYLADSAFAAMHVVIIHPEQWNGGSDRCTIGLLRHFVQGGHKVVWLTTMIDHYWADKHFHGVEIVGPSMFKHVPLHPGDWYSQNTALAYYYMLCHAQLKPDLIVVDHSASCIPLLKWRFPSCRVLFYCHFPQQLVTPSRFFLYRWYSWLMGLVEGRLYDYADLVMVNSEFTGRQFRAVMPSVPPSKIRVVYPPCDVDSLSIASSSPVSRKQRPPNDRYIFLSMNRFWPEKRLDIILDAAAQLKQMGARPLIQMAGSVMPHIPESKIYYELLLDRSKEMGLGDVIEFLPDPSDARKFELYRQCDSVIYTPPNEHFGIVPVEALEQRRPVIVIDSGGPAETVLEGITGTKIADTCGNLLAEAMLAHMGREVWEELDEDEHYAKQRTRFERDFSWAGFGRRIDQATVELFSLGQKDVEKGLLGKEQKAPATGTEPSSVVVVEAQQPDAANGACKRGPDEAVDTKSLPILANGVHLPNCRNHALPAETENPSLALNGHGSPSRKNGLRLRNGQIHWKKAELGGKFPAQDRKNA